MIKSIVRKFAAVSLACVMCGSLARAAENDLPPLTERPVLRLHAAEISTAAVNVRLLGASRAGRRLVAVGDHGVVLLSDDDGRSFRQARRVPVDSTLTSVSFSDSKNGWAVGHWGVIIRTEDGGETWTLQRSDLQVDQPLFAVHFADSKRGWAVGLWSLMLHTDDGGANWSVVRIPPPPGAKKADRNFYSIFANDKGALYVACEQGLVLRSKDEGATWTYAATGYSGSFWTGIALHDGTLLVGGLHGTVFRSADGGDTWEHVQTPYKSSITGFAQDAPGTIVSSSLDGVVLNSTDDGASFTGEQKSDREALTAVIDTSVGKPLLLSVSGIVKQ